MSKRTMGLIAMAFGGILSVGRSAVAQDHHIFLAGKAKMTVTDALEGAMRRLAMPECQHLFEDFTDPAGRALTVNLAATAKSPVELLAALYFVDGDDTIQCRANEVVAAFTEQRSHVIHVCGKRFVRFAAKPKGGEILLIHELLHTLGLGENPPTSAQITDAVLNRCG